MMHNPSTDPTGDLFDRIEALFRDSCDHGSPLDLDLWRTPLYELLEEHDRIVAEQAALAERERIIKLLEKGRQATCWCISKELLIIKPGTGRVPCQPCRLLNAHIALIKGEEQ